MPNARTPENNGPGEAGQRSTTSDSAFRLLFSALFIKEYGLREGWRMSRNRYEFTGLLVESIIGHSIWHPNKNTDDLIYKEAASGAHLVAYDFLRPQKLPPYRGRPLRQSFEGTLYTTLIPEVSDNPADALTPTSLLNIYKIDHRLTLDKSTIEQAVGAALIRKTTLSEAYGITGLDKLYGEALNTPGIGDATVYQVTPKGNTLVHIVRGSGTPEELPEGELHQRRLGNPLPAWATNATAMEATQQ